MAILNRIEVETPNVPGYRQRVDATKYEAMRGVLLVVVPSYPPGLSQAQIREAVLPFLPQDLFPGGAKAEWWAKVVQLDLEAKGMLVREDVKPLRWWRRVI